MTVITRVRARSGSLPGRTGTVPLIVVTGIAFASILMFGFSPSLNPIDILAGRLFEVAVPDVVGKTQVGALATLAENRLEGDVSFDYSSTVELGLVIRQFPPAGSTRERGA